MDEFSLLGVVLAGGRSSRMGVDKATLPHPQATADDRSFTYLDHAIARLRPLTATIAVSGKSFSAKVPNPAGPPQEPIAIPDDSPFQGPARGVAQSLAHAHQRGFSGILVTPIDMPDLTTDDLRLLVDAWCLRPTPPSSSGERLPIITATFDHQCEPLLAIYPCAYLSDLQAVATSTHRSLYRWLQSQATLKIALPANASRNVNHPHQR